MATEPIPRRSPISRTPSRLTAKRIIDLTIAVPVLVLSSPLLAMVALAVRVRLGRPILFRQLRLGLHGEAFVIRKFRTMTDERDGHGHARSDAERLTPLGRFLRQTSLDELPELLNVVEGTMSLVGPRPLLPQYRDRYSPDQMRRHDVAPGITGWAQVHGRNDITWEEKFKLDGWYVDHASLAVDARILAMTVAKTLRREGITLAGSATTEEFRGSGASPAVSPPEEARDP